MRIAQVSPLHESVPPKLYGGTERVVSYLTEELVELGHDVTLFASGDSVTAAKLVPCCETGLRLSKAEDPNIFHVLMLEQIWSRCDKFDIIHFHIDPLHLPAARRMMTPSVTTQHGRLDLQGLSELYREYADLPMVSISNSQRRPVPWVNWADTVHHGLPQDLYRFNPKGGEYLVFTGRIAPEKRPDWAIEIARRAGVPLRIAAKVSAHDQPYFDQVIRPLLNTPVGDIEFLGEVDDVGKAKLLCGALALLFPIDWPEPFGMVMIEAMACGTPVIALNRASVPEIIDDGKSGIIVHDLDEAVQAVDRVRSISRVGCRQCFDQRFTARRMTQDYLTVYEKLTRNTPRRSVRRTSTVIHKVAE